MGILRHLLNVFPSNAGGRKTVMMASRTGKELRRKILFFIDEGLLIFIID